MSEYIVEVNDHPTIKQEGWNVRCDDLFIQREEIVRCKDCKHMSEVTERSMLFNDETFTVHRCGADQWSTASLMPLHKVKPDGFCAWGERRDG